MGENTSSVFSCEIPVCQIHVQPACAQQRGTCSLLPLTKQTPLPWNTCHTHTHTHTWIYTPPPPHWCFFLLPSLSNPTPCSFLCVLSVFKHQSHPIKLRSPWCFRGFTLSFQVTDHFRKYLAIKPSDITTFSRLWAWLQCTLLLLLFCIHSLGYFSPQRKSGVLVSH